MREISLHILDIVQNSIAAGARRVEIKSTADTECDRLTVTVKDDGSGMPYDMIARITDPFVTTRTTRKVGLGLPMLKAAAEMCGGELRIESVEGKGTEVTAEFGLSHIDRMPYGDIVGTIVTIVAANPDRDFRYEHTVDGRTFVLDTADIRKELGDVPINALPVLSWLRGYLEEGIARVGAIS